jgi:chromate transporter
MPEAAPAAPRSSTDLFITFTALALQGFGGVLAVAQRVLCERKRWLTNAEFVEMLSIAQILPGPNVCNLSLMIGDRFFGWRGAFAALLGMMAAPLVIVLALAAWFSHSADHPLVARALHGMSIIAAGLIAGTALKLAAALRSNPLGWMACCALGAATFVGIAVLRWPLVYVLLSLGSVAYGAAWWRLGVQRALK